MGGTSFMGNIKKQAESMATDLDAKKKANTELLNSDKERVQKFIGEQGLSEDQFTYSDPTDTANKFKQWKVGKADQAYLDVKTQLLGSPGRKATLLADPIQGMSKLLGKSVL